VSQRLGSLSILIAIEHRKNRTDLKAGRDASFKGFKKENGVANSSMEQ
jgi:hypothetical protein